MTILSGIHSYTGMFKNKIINGNFDYWQRGTSLTSGSGLRYLSDRWKTLSSGSTYTVSQQAFTPGQTDVPNDPTYFHRIVVTSVAGAGNACQLVTPIENVRTLANSKCTLTFWAKADSAKNIALTMYQVFDGSTDNYSINPTTCALTTTWKKFTIVSTLPSVSGKTIGANSYVSPLFWFDSGSTYNSSTNSLGQQSGTFDIAQVQLEPGEQSTNFEIRPIGLELSLCHRYYQSFIFNQSYPIGVGHIVRGTSTYGMIKFLKLNVPMRITPVINYPTVGTNFTIVHSVDSVAVGPETSINAYVSNNIDVILGIYTTGSLSGGHVYLVNYNSGMTTPWTFDAEL